MLLCILYIDILGKTERFSIYDFQQYFLRNILIRVFIQNLVCFI